MRTLALALCLATAPALSAPPAPDTPIARDLAPHAKWITGQWIPCPDADEHPGHYCWCCSLGDGRPVEVEQKADGTWRALVTHGFWPLQPDHWEDMPVRIYVEHSPFAAQGFLWRAPQTDENYCFAPPNGGV